MSDWAEDLHLDLYQILEDVKPEAAPTCDGSDGGEAQLDIPIDWDNESYSWDKMNTDLFGGALPLSVESCSNVEDDLPSPGAESDTSIPASTSNLALSRNGALMQKYGLSDEQLSDMTLKQLKKQCTRQEDDFTALKAYRRTCLNRNYARSSRNKQQVKTHSLSTQLKDAQEEIRQLKKQLEEKSLRIQYLELENRLLLDFNKTN